jgi:recombination protein U
MYGYGNRGMTFESLIGYANSRYRSTGTAIITKQNTKFLPIRNGSGAIVSCKVEEKATVDYMGRFGDRPLAFEAKHCAEDTISLNRVEPHQYEFLRDWSQGGICFVLVSFNFRSFYLIPYYGWAMAVLANRQKRRGDPVDVLPMDGFEATGKASIRKDELPDAWRVESGNAAALDYLRTVKRLWRLELEVGKG